MSDTDLRDLERVWRETRLDADLTRMLVERVRGAQLEPRDLHAAAAIRFGPALDAAQRLSLASSDPPVMDTVRGLNRCLLESLRGFESASPETIDLALRTHNAVAGLLAGGALEPVTELAWTFNHSYWESLGSEPDRELSAICCKVLDATRGMARSDSLSAATCQLALSLFSATAIERAALSLLGYRDG